MRAGLPLRFTRDVKLQCHFSSVYLDCAESTRLLHGGSTATDWTHTQTLSCDQYECWSLNFSCKIP